MVRNGVDDTMMMMMMIEMMMMMSTIVLRRVVAIRAMFGFSLFVCYPHLFLLSAFSCLCSCVCVCLCVCLQSGSKSGNVVAKNGKTTGWTCEGYSTILMPSTALLLVRSNQSPRACHMSSVHSKTLQSHQASMWHSA